MQDPSTKKIQNVLNQNATVNQFGVSNTPFHTHNGVDSPRISYKDLTDVTNSSFIAGSGTMSGGILDITDSRIKSTSTCVATRSGVASSAGGFAQLATGYQSGTTMRIFEGSFTATWKINYIINF